MSIMSAVIGADCGPRTPGQAVEWARAMLRPGVAVVVGIAIPAGSTVATDIAVVDTDGCLRVHGRADDAAQRALADLMQASASRVLLAYNAPNVREWVTFDAVRGGVGRGWLADPGRWGCIMRARSAAFGRPDQLYPLGTAHGAVAAAGRALAVVEDIARRRFLPVQPLPVQSPPVQSLPVQPGPRRAGPW